MKFCIASPQCGTSKLFEVEEEKRLVQLTDKRIGQEFDGDILGDEFKGYVFKILGGSDKEGFPMKQGVLVSSRVKLLLKGGTVGCRKYRVRSGERRRKTVRGCIVSLDIALLNLKIVKEGEEKIEGLTDHIVPRRLGPKRASKIRRLFNLTKEDDVRKFVLRRELPQKEGKNGKIMKARSKAPKIQRLITPAVLARRAKKKRNILSSLAEHREERQKYFQLIRSTKTLHLQRAKAAVLRQMAGRRKKELETIKRDQIKKAAAEAAAAKAAAAAAAAAKSKPAPKAKAANWCEQTIVF